VGSQFRLRLKLIGPLIDRGRLARVRKTAATSVCSCALTDARLAGLDSSALLNQLKERGLSKAAKLAVGDGALGFWAALGEVFPTTRAQRSSTLPRASMPPACYITTSDLQQSAQSLSFRGPARDGIQDGRRQIGPTQSPYSFAERAFHASRSTPTRLAITTPEPTRLGAGAHELGAPAQARVRYRYAILRRLWR
jgi:hypothetical protein